MDYKIKDLMPCKICGIVVKGAKPGIYLVNIFNEHLKLHNITVSDYVKKYIGNTYCVCGCGEESYYYLKNSTVRAVKWLPGHSNKDTNDKFKLSCEAMSKKRSRK